MDNDKKSGHDFNPKDFEPGRIHKISKNTVMFGDDMTPAVALWNPHNIGAAVRAASCFGAKAVIFSRDRIATDSKKGYRKTVHCPNILFKTLPEICRHSFPQHTALI